MRKEEERDSQPTYLPHNLPTRWTIPYHLPWFLVSFTFPLPFPRFTPQLITGPTPRTPPHPLKTSAKPCLHKPERNSGPLFIPTENSILTTCRFCPFWSRTQATLPLHTHTTYVLCCHCAHTTRTHCTHTPPSEWTGGDCLGFPLFTICPTSCASSTPPHTPCTHTFLCMPGTGFGRLVWFPPPLLCGSTHHTGSPPHHTQWFYHTCPHLVHQSPVLIHLQTTTTTTSTAPTLHTLIAL